MENLLKAWDGFKKGKREKNDVQLFEYNLEDNLFCLYRDLIYKRYCHGQYTDFYIQDPKLRHIHKADESNPMRSKVGPPSQNQAIAHPP